MRAMPPSRPTSMQTARAEARRRAPERQRREQEAREAQTPEDARDKRAASTPGRTPPLRASSGCRWSEVALFSEVTDARQRTTSPGDPTSSRDDPAGDPGRRG